MLQRLVGKTQDLVAVISGRLKKNITLDGSLSYDPVAAHGDQSGMNFTWHYGEITGNYSSVQGRKRGFFIAVNESPFTIMEEHLACRFTRIHRLCLSVIFTYLNWLWPKTITMLALINHNFFYTVHRVLSFGQLLSTCMFLRAESS